MCENHFKKSHFRNLAIQKEFEIMFCVFCASLVRSTFYSRFSPIAIDKFTQEDESNYCRNLSTNLCDEFLDSGSCFLRNEYEFFVLVPLAQNAFYRKFFEQLS